MTQSRSVKKSILFVCLGNICRSPTGESVFRELLVKRNLEDQYHIDSAGTIGNHAGHPADARMQAAAEKRGYQLDSRSRKITAADLKKYTLVIAMDRDNLRDIKMVCSDSVSEIRLLSDFLGDEWPSDVPDPYHGGEAGFEYVLDMIESACPPILAHLQTL